MGNADIMELYPTAHEILPQLQERLGGNEEWMQVNMAK